MSILSNPQSRASCSMRFWNTPISSMSQIVHIAKANARCLSDISKMVNGHHNVLVGFTSRAWTTCHSHQCVQQLTAQADLNGGHTDLCGRSCHLWPAAWTEKASRAGLLRT